MLPRMRFSESAVWRVDCEVGWRRRERGNPSVIAFHDGGTERALLPVPQQATATHNFLDTGMPARRVISSALVPPACAALRSCSVYNC